MIKDEVLSWLRAGQPYEEGVDLYAKHCNNATLLKNFQRKDTESRKESNQLLQKRKQHQPSHKNKAKISLMANQCFVICQKKFSL